MIGADRMAKSRARAGAVMDDCLVKVTIYILD